jgi:hypothetical protein
MTLNDINIKKIKYTHCASPLRFSLALALALALTLRSSASRLSGTSSFLEVST